MWTVYEMAYFLSCPAWRWTSSCDHAATSSTVLYRSSSSTSGRCLSFSSTAECVLPRCEQRQVPKGSCSFWTRLFLQAVQREVSLLVGARSSTSQWLRGFRSAVWRLLKDFPIFSPCSRCPLGFRSLFPRAPCIWQPLVQRKLVGDFLTFPRAIGLRVPAQFAPGSPGIPSMANSCSSSRAPGQLVVGLASLVQLCCHRHDFASSTCVRPTTTTTQKYRNDRKPSQIDAGKRKRSEPHFATGPFADPPNPAKI